ncbi:MAG: mechanosensitive ion channel family protein [Treponema sp.]|uniref:mechanosensitive ion channel family protein n=1 Tax=Treponema sp. TaxID=166 RepID=UPI00298DF0EA|nr:mechanosensitive ion channel family protein [Treponema sp.]MCQ2599908.1 mechanosensitive ion channel family protein [Treponema sp.]
MEEEVVNASEEAAMMIETAAPGQQIGEAVTSVTQNASTFFHWIKTFITWENLFKVVGIVLFVLLLFLIYKIAVRAIKKIPPEKLSAHKSAMLVRGIHYLYYFVVIMYVLGAFGVKLSAIWGAAGVAGVALAFAAQTSVSNIISGIFIVAEKTMKTGDLITVGNETGIVDVIGLLSVQIHTLDNQLIRIPNSTIINSNMINTSYFPKRRLCIGVSVSYDTDMEYALETLKKVPALCKSVIKDPEPAVWFDKFDESGINLTLAVWFKSEDFLKAKNEVFIAIKKVFDEAKIEIPYNKLDVKFLGTDAGDMNISAVNPVKKLPAKKTTAKKSVSKK